MFATEVELFVCRGTERLIPLLDSWENVLRGNLQLQDFFKIGHLLPLNQLKISFFK